MQSSENMSANRSPLFDIATVAEVAVDILVDTLYKEGRECSTTPLLVQEYGNSQMEVWESDGICPKTTFPFGTSRVVEHGYLIG